MRASKDKDEAESSKFHSRDACSGFKVPSGHGTNFSINGMGLLARDRVRGWGVQRSSIVFSIDSSTYFPPPTFSDLEQECNTDNFEFSNITIPRALLRPLDPLPGFSAPGGDRIYRGLPERDAFRLLQILPGDGEMLQCKLLVCGLNENEASYEALSYTWGIPDASSDREIEIITNSTSRSMTISGNLYIALRELRRRHTSRVLWADAICINQEDVKEKGQQVALMGKIFNSAWRVIIWLGQAEDRCCCGKTVLEKSLSSTYKAFSEICSVVNEWLTQAGQKTLEATYQDISQDDQFIMHGAFVGRIGIRPSAMERLFSRRTQSYNSAPGEFHGSGLGLRAAILVHKPELTLGQAMVPAGTMNTYLMYRLSVSQKCLPGLEFSFAQLLQATRHFECNNSKDKIYGLLGIKTTDSTATKIVPDYRETTTIQQVYEDVARLVLGAGSPLKFLSGAGTFGDFDRLGPSWVPSWHKRRPWTILPAQKNPGFKCASEVPMELQSNNKAEELVLKGVIIDHISSMPEGSDYWGTFDKNEESRENFLNQPSWSEQAWKKCAMTLTCGSDGRAYPIDDEARHLANLAALVLSGRIVHWVVKYLIVLQDVIEPEDDDMTQAKYLTEIAGCGNACRYNSALEPTYEPYKLFKTASKDFGVGPVDMKIGDKLCVLFGAEVPFLLRPKEDGYLVIGECYVYDLMHGEILEKLAADPDGQLKAEWIKLI